MYNELVGEANKLMKTFTIRYNIGDYGKDLYSSTYDELSGWLRKALKEVGEKEVNGKESDTYAELRRYRGRAGDITLNEMMHIVSLLDKECC